MCDQFACAGTCDRSKNQQSNSRSSTISARHELISRSISIKLISFYLTIWRVLFFCTYHIVDGDKDEAHRSNECASHPCAANSLHVVLIYSPKNNNPILLVFAVSFNAAKNYIFMKIKLNVWRSNKKISAQKTSCNREWSAERERERWMIYMKKTMCHLPFFSHLCKTVQRAAGANRRKILKKKHFV